MPIPPSLPATVAEELGNGVILEMVQISGGAFWMGQTEAEKQTLISQWGEEDYQKYFVRELPRHQVTVPSFFMGKFVVTQAQYEAVMGINPAKEYGSKFVAPDKPVVGASWQDATAFCQQLSKRTGKSYRLPSEAEWEYACRACSETPFYFGDTITTDQANYNGNYVYGDGKKGQYREQTTSVGAFQANEFGLFDMHGNVWEWCLDLWHENYRGAPSDGSAWLENTPQSNNRRVRRGGSWFIHPRDCRSAYRYHITPDNRNSFLGFRVVLAPQ